MALTTMQGGGKTITRPDRDEAHDHAVEVYHRALAIALEGEEAFIARKLAEYDARTEELHAEVLR